VDNQPAGTPQQFGPDRRLTAVTGVAGLIAVALAVFASDAGAQVFAAVAAVVLLGYAVTDLLFWPRLTLSARGVQVQGPFERLALGWTEITAVRADVRTRHGLRSTALEVDAGDTLVVLSRRALGADPEAVAAVAASYRDGR